MLLIICARRFRLGLATVVAAGGALLALSDRFGVTMTPFGALAIPNWLMLAMVTVTLATPYAAWQPTVVELSTPLCSPWFMAVPQVLAGLASVAASVAFLGTSLLVYYVAWVLVMLALENLLVCILGPAAWYAVFIAWIALIVCLTSARVDVYPDGDWWLPLAVLAWLATSVVLATARGRLRLGWALR